MGSKERGYASEEDDEKVIKQEVKEETDAERGKSLFNFVSGLCRSISDFDGKTQVYEMFGV